MTRLTAVAILVVLTLFGVVGCVTSMGDDVPDQTITLAEAAARAEQHLRDVVAELPGARLDDRSGPPIVPCGGFVGGPDGLVFAHLSYRIRDVPPERNAATFEAALAFWLANGYTLGTDARDQRYLSVGAPDGTGLDLQESADSSRTLSIGASSRCVWPEGTPPTR